VLQSHKCIRKYFHAFVNGLHGVLYKVIGVYNTKGVWTILEGPKTDMHNYEMESVLLKNDCTVVLKYEGSLFLY